MGKPWLKLWTDTLSDRKLRRLAPEQKWCWVGMLLLAAETDNGGRIELAEGVPMLAEDFQDALDVEADTWESAYDYFLRMGMISIDGNGFVTVVNYAKRQDPKDPTGAERQQRYRDKARDSREKTQPVTRYVTAPSRVISRVEAEAEAEAELQPVEMPKVGANQPAAAGLSGFALVEQAHGQYIGAKMELAQARTYEQWLNLTSPQAIIDALAEAARSAHHNGGRYKYALAILTRQKNDRTLPRSRITLDVEAPTEDALSWM